MLLSGVGKHHLAIRRVPQSLRRFHEVCVHELTMDQVRVGWM